MGASIWTGDSTIPVTANADNSYAVQAFTATAGQTVFTLTVFAYQINTGSLDVYINGVTQLITVDFLETSNTSVTLTSPAEENDLVVIRGLIGGTAAQSAAESAAQAQAIAEMLEGLNVPELPLAIELGGTNADTSNQAFNNLSPVLLKGDLIVGNGDVSNARMSKGDDYQALTADAAESNQNLVYRYVDIHKFSSTITSNYTIADIVPTYFTVVMASKAQSITAYDATFMQEGITYIIDNRDGMYPVGFRNFAGVLTGRVIPPGGIAEVWLKDNSTSSGQWEMIGSDLEAGFVTFENIFSSTYSNGQTFSRYIELDTNTAIYFMTPTGGGIAAFVFNFASSLLGTPLTLTATSVAFPWEVFKIDNTRAIVFYGATTITNAVILSVSGTTVTVGTPITLDASITVSQDLNPSIAQLSSSLYVGSGTVSGNLNTQAFSVSGTTITKGTHLVTAIVDLAFGSGLSTVYALTATTAALIYEISTAGGNPYTIVCNVISVSGTTCTLGTSANMNSSQGNTSPASCKLSATKILVADVQNTTLLVFMQTFTIAGTVVTAGTLNTGFDVGSFGTAQLKYNIGNRYSPVLFPMSASMAMLNYRDSGSNISRVVLVTESSGVLTKGQTLYRSTGVGSTGTSSYGRVVTPKSGLTEFCAIRQFGASSTGYKHVIVPHKITGTTITVGSEYSMPEGYTIADISTSGAIGRFENNDYIFSTANSTLTKLNNMVVFSSNGDYVTKKGIITVPNSYGSICAQVLSGSRITTLGNTSLSSTIIDQSTAQVKFIAVEVCQ